MSGATKANHTIHRDHVHCVIDNSIPPFLTVAPGEVIEFETFDGAGGQLTAESTVDEIRTLDFTRVNPATGPVYIDGAEPGDAVAVTVLSFAPSGWGWTANIPGFGLLADQFPDPALHIWKYAPDLSQPALFGPGGKVPLRPFAGVMALAPAAPGPHSVIPPIRVGGNMDTRDLAAGTVLYLPVEVAGGLFSIGDTHAAQGDGEVCGTAIESPMCATVKLDLVKGANLAFPRYTTPGPVSRHFDTMGYEVTMGIGPDLMECARDALKGMIDLLGRQHGLAAVDAYMLCSACGDLRITEIVDQPNWVVGFYFPRLVFA